MPVRPKREGGGGRSSEQIEDGGRRRAREKPRIEGIYGLVDKSRGNLRDSEPHSTSLSHYQT